MKTRKLTIERFLGYPHANPKSPAACLRLKGFWLRACGFEPGDQVEVMKQAECLVIRKVRPAGGLTPRERRVHARRSNENAAAARIWLP